MPILSPDVPAGILYLSGVSNPPVINAAITERRLGMLAQPGNALHRQGQSFGMWGIDNGAYGKAMAGTPWTDLDTLEYFEYLIKVRSEACMANIAFATAPDVLEFVDDEPRGDAAATWERGVELFPLVRRLGFPVALVAQDGITDTHPYGADWDAFDAVFLGGSNDFKLGAEGAVVATEAKARGKWLHMGRVNSFKRIKYAADIGCDSVDGTYIRFKVSTNLPKVLGWLEDTAPYHVLGGT